MSLTSRSDTGEARMRKTSCRLTNNQYLQSMDHRLFMTGEKSQLLISPSPDFVERPFSISKPRSSSPSSLFTSGCQELDKLEMFECSDIQTIAIHNFLPKYKTLQKQIRSRWIKTSSSSCIASQRRRRPLEQRRSSRHRQPCTNVENAYIGGIKKGPART